jgi:SPP1 family predicted phage head-tail adaptor
MKIGRLRHRIKLQTYTAFRDSFGAEEPEWTDVATVWASVTPASGKEYFASAQTNAELTTKITMRYLSGITPNMRVVFDERIFEIVSVLNYEERNVELNLLCKESVSDG